MINSNEIQEMVQQRAEIEKYNIAKKHEEMRREMEEGRRLINLTMESKPIDVVEIQQTRNNKLVLSPFAPDTFVVSQKDVMTFYASSGNGKTTFSSHFIAELIKQQKRVLMVSTEESEDDMWMRVAAYGLGLNYDQFNLGTAKPEDWDAIAKFVEDHRKYVVFLVKESFPALSDGDALRKLLQNKEKVVGKFDIIMIDYLQGITKYGADTNDIKAQNTFANDINDLKSYIGCPILVFSQCMPINVATAKTSDISQVMRDQDLYLGRTRGGKNIYTVSTLVVEVRADSRNNCSWVCIHKMRHPTSKTQHFARIGFDKKKMMLCDIDTLGSAAVVM